MKLRSGKNTILYTNQMYHYSEKCHNIKLMRYDKLGNMYINPNYHNEKAVVLNKLYSLFITKFTQIHDECIQFYNEKEDTFIRLILGLEKSTNRILKEIEASDVERKTLKKNLMRALEKIKNYKNTYRKEKNESLCRLSCKLGSSLAINISEFL